MPRGKVKYFNEPRGWGIIATQDSSSDIYFHHTAINMAGFKTVKRGQEVEFDLAMTKEAGAQARNVEIVQ